MSKLEEMRRRLKEAENKTTTKTFDNSVYPIWNLKTDAEAVVRFLPDGDSNNAFFWRERQIIKLPFSGVKGETDSREVHVQVPCMEMYNATCPILAEVRAWFKDPALESMGKKYWKKRSYIFQGLVVLDGLDEKEIPENPIRRLIIGPQIFQIIKASLMDSELEELPTDYVHGLDFRIKKGSKGGYADYSTSTWSRRERPLSDQELAAISKYGLFDLNEFLPKKPNEIELAIIKEMFEASVDGEAYDPERWGRYFKPAGLNQNTGDPVREDSEKTTKTTSSPPVAEPVKSQPASSLDDDPPVATDDRARAILDMIKKRQSAA